MGEITKQIYSLICSEAILAISYSMNSLLYNLVLFKRCL